MHHSSHFLSLEINPIAVDNEIASCYNSTTILLLLNKQETAGRILDSNDVMRDFCSDVQQLSIVSL